MALLALACNELTGDFSTIIAIEYTGPPAPRLQEGDTLRLTARALDLKGDSIPDAQIVWRILELDSVQVGFQLDTLTGLVTAVTPGGPWRIQARADDLRTDPPISLVVSGAPDTLVPLDTTRVTVDAGVMQSPGLTVRVLDLTTSPGTDVPLQGVLVTYTLIDPAPGTAAADGVALGVQGLVGTDPHVASGVSTGTGQVVVTLQRVGVTQPDSAVVDASAVTALGAPVPGSPVRFVVLFVNN